MERENRKTDRELGFPPTDEARSRVGRWIQAKSKKQSLEPHFEPESISKQSAVATLIAVGFQLYRASTTRRLPKIMRIGGPDSR